MFDNGVGLFAITGDQYGNLQDLVFNIGGVSSSWCLAFRIEPTWAVIQVDFALTPNAQIWPRSLNSDIGGTADGIYLIVGDAGESINSAIVYDPTWQFHRSCNQQ